MPRPILISVILTSLTFATYTLYSALITVALPPLQSTIAKNNRKLKSFESPPPAFLSGTSSASTILGLENNPTTITYLDSLNQELDSISQEIDDLLQELDALEQNVNFDI